MQTVSRTVLLVALLLAVAAPAGAVDLHRVWEDRCGGCHGHAGAFARDQAPLREPLAPFLERHGGGLEPTIAEGMAGLLTSAARTAERFQEECRICHGRAADFVRQHLAVRDGRLIGRYTGRDVEPFLDAGHARLSEDGAAFFTEQLRRVLGEVRYGEGG